MLLFDGHLDLAMNALMWNRDLTLPVSEMRRLELESGIQKRGFGRGTVSYPDMCRGHIGLCIATVIARCQKPGNPLPGFRAAESAYASAMGQLAYYRLREQQGILRFLHDLPSLDAHVAEWRAGLAAGDVESLPIGLILTMEGADPVVYPEQLHAWKAAGLRCIGLSHYGLSNYAHGTASVGGLTDMGRALLPEVEKAGLLLDLTHLADGAFWEVMDRYNGPVQCSHQCCRALVPGDRQMDDRQLQAVFERGGVVGVALDAWMLYPDWQRDVTGPTPDKNLTAVADQIDHICQLAGNTRHAGIGTDLDGGYGTEQTPADLDTIADMQNIADLLRPRGYSESDIQAIFSDNLINLFRRIWS